MQLYNQLHRISIVLMTTSQPAHYNIYFHIFIDTSLSPNISKQGILSAHHHHRQFISWYNWVSSLSSPSSIPLQLIVIPTRQTGVNHVARSAVQLLPSPPFSSQSVPPSAPSLSQHRRLSHHLTITSICIICSLYFLLCQFGPAPSFGAGWLRH